VLQKLAQWDPYEIWIEIRFFCRHFLVMHRSLVACSDLNYRGEAGLDFAADIIHALVASDDAEVHGASVDGVGADVQGTFARFFLEDGADDLLGERVPHHVRLGQVCRFPVVQAIDAPVAMRTSLLLCMRMDRHRIHAVEGPETGLPPFQGQRRPQPRRRRGSHNHQHLRGRHPQLRRRGGDVSLRLPLRNWVVGSRGLPPLVTLRHELLGGARESGVRRSRRGVETDRRHCQGDGVRHPALGAGHEFLVGGQDKDRAPDLRHD